MPLLRSFLAYYVNLSCFRDKTPSEQPGNAAFCVHINIHGGGVLGKAGHRHNAAADDDHKPSTGGKAMMTGSAFIDLYYETYSESVDNAVIAVNVYVLYSDTAAKY